MIKKQVEIAGDYQDKQNCKDNYQINSILRAPSWKNKNKKIEKKCYKRCSAQITSYKTNTKKTIKVQK